MTETQSNVLAFPKSKIVREVPQETEEAIAERKIKGVTNYADNIAEELSTAIMYDLSNCGIEIQDENSEKDFIYLSLVLRALIYRSCNIDHPMHKLIQEAVTLRKITENTNAVEISNLDNSEEIE